jgi:two-component system, chemotaxis family, sensor kinase CheA
MSGRGFSLGVKLAMSTFAVLSIVSSLVFYELTTRSRSNFLGSKRQAAELVSDLFGVSVVAPLDFGDDQDVQKTVENLRVNREITFAAVWRQGSPDPIATIGQQSPGALPPLGGEVRTETRIVGESLEIVRRIERSDGTALGAFLIHFSLASVFAELQAAKRGMLIGTTGTAAVVALLILGFARWQIVLPLERLVVAARRLETGEQGVTVDVAAQDEMGRLASAFNTMSAAIVDRERHLATAMARLRELFDNMRQGIVVFGRNGLVDEAPSKQAAVLFGPDVAGRPIEELFYADAPRGSPVRQAFEAWLAIAFDVPAERWSEFAVLAPADVHRKHRGAPQWLEMQFTPVVQEGRVERIMVLATDVTGQRQLEQATQTLEEQHARQMGIMRRLVAGGGQVFVSFLESAEERLAKSLRQARDPMITSDALTEIFEQVHTIRGEARTFELPELASECQGLERLLRDMRDDTLTLSRRPRDGIVARLERALQAVARARELFIEASPIGPAVLDQMTVRKSDVRRLADELATADEGVRRAIANLTSRPFGECVTGVEAAAPRWAQEVGKEARVLIGGRDVRVPERIAPVLRAVLPHIVRNAIAHGIESPDRRRSSGKPREGTMRLSAAEEGARLVVRIEDDGSGLDEPAILAQARLLGLGHGTASELLFSAGVSTAAQVDEIAGQGIGLWAVREGLRKIGGDIRVCSEAGRGAEFEITAPYAAD